MTPLIAGIWLPPISAGRDNIAMSAERRSISSEERVRSGGPIESTGFNTKINCSSAQQPGTTRMV